MTMYTFEEIVDDIKQLTGATELTMENPFYRLDATYRCKLSDLFPSVAGASEETLEKLIRTFIFGWRVKPIEGDLDALFEQHPDAEALLFASTDPTFPYKGSTVKMKLYEVRKEGEEVEKVLDRLLLSINYGPGVEAAVMIVQRNKLGQTMNLTLGGAPDSPLTMTAPALQ